ncbi:MAG: hypothetical protein QM504_06545 [Pseudomonadota bacterium]
MNINDFKPSLDLYKQIRAAFIMKDTSFGAWCKENKVNMTNAKTCLIGGWNGPKGQALKEKVIIASGITETSF